MLNPIGITWLIWASLILRVKALELQFLSWHGGPQRTTFGLKGML